LWLDRREFKVDNVDDVPVVVDEHVAFVEVGECQYEVLRTIPRSFVPEYGEQSSKGCEGGELEDPVFSSED
jgi:hypothetical protein